MRHYCCYGLLVLLEYILLCMQFSAHRAYSLAVRLVWRWLPVSKWVSVYDEAFSSSRGIRLGGFSVADHILGGLIEVSSANWSLHCMPKVIRINIGGEPVIRSIEVVCLWHFKKVVGSWWRIGARYHDDSNHCHRYGRNFRSSKRKFFRMSLHYYRRWVDVKLSGASQWRPYMANGFWTAMNPNMIFLVYEIGIHGFFSYVSETTENLKKE